MAEPEWGYYGRAAEQAEIERIIDAGRWFFCSITGRRRIGKTSLIQQALQARPSLGAFYVQVPDSDELGVVQAFHDAYQDLGGSAELIRQSVRTIRHMAMFIRFACEGNSIVAIDEFQYFHRNSLGGMVSALQAEVDLLRDTAKGGLFVLGSSHREMSAMLEDRKSPLFNRLTHKIDLGHWDFATLFEMFEAHRIQDPEQWAFLWSLFEGVPKFYRDAFEQGVLRPDPDYRQRTLRRLFFEGSSPLRDEAANWFLRELRGRYDSVLKTLAQRGTCAYRELVGESSSSGTEQQPSAYLHSLIDRYRLVERRDPLLAGDKTRRARYAITDNFLGAWLQALARNVQMARIRPVEEAVARADLALESHEIFTFEKMIRQLIEECSRKGVGNFPVTEMIRGYWNKSDRSGIEIELIAVDEDHHTVRFGACRRRQQDHDDQSCDRFEGQVTQFLATPEARRFGGWRVERCLFSPDFNPDHRRRLEDRGFVCRDLADFALALSDPGG